MSTFIEDSSGTNGGSEVQPIMTESWHYHICSICSVNCILTEDKEKTSKLIAVCDKCRKRNSLFKVHGEGEHFSNNQSNDYRNKRESEESGDSSESRSVTYNEFHSIDNLPLQDECLNDFDDNLTFDTDNIHNRSTSLNTDECSRPTLSHISEVKHTNGIISELQTVDYNDSVEYYVDNDLSTRCLNENLISAFDTTAPSELKIISMKTMAVTSNESESVSGKTYRQVDPTLSTNSDRKCINGVVSELLTIDYRIGNLDQHGNKARFLNDGLVSAADASAPTELQIMKVEDITTNNYNDNESVSLKTDSDDTSTDKTSKKSRTKVLSDISLDKCVEIEKGVSSVHAQNTTIDVTRAVDPFSEISMHGLSKYTCSFCFQKFVKTELLEHMQLHRPDSSVKCGICEEMCSTEVLLGQHYQYIHSDSFSRLLACSFCPFTTKRKNASYFIGHVRQHTGDKPYVCTHCGQRCVDRGRLVAHIKFSHMNHWRSKTLKSPYPNERCNKIISGQQIAIASKGETPPSVSMPNAAVMQQYFSPCKSVLHNSVSVHSSISQQSPSASQDVPQQTASIPQAVSKHTASAPQAVAQHTVFAPHAVSREIITNKSQVTSSQARQLIHHHRNELYNKVQQGSKRSIMPVALRPLSHESVTGVSLLQTIAPLVSSPPIDVTLHTINACESIVLQTVSVPQPLTNNIVSVSSLQDLTYHSISAPAAHCTPSVYTTVSQQSDSALPGLLQCSVDASQVASRPDIFNPNLKFSAIAPRSAPVSFEVGQQTFGVALDVAKHLEIPAYGPHACSICCQRFSHKIEMMEHKQLHRPDRSEKCGICEQTCNTEILLLEHYVLKHFNKVSQVFTCIFCSYSCKPVRRFIRHVRWHTSERPYMCTQCGKRFINLSHLITHGKHAHQAASEQAVSACQATSQQTAGGLEAITPQITSILTAVAQQSVSVSQAVDQSLRLSAHDPLEHVCSICCQRFAERIEMLNHEQLHIPDRNVKCGICNKICKTDKSLQHHCQRKHLDRSSLLYNCNLCLYTTKQVKIFCSHVHLHTGEIPYKCTHCEKGCLNKYELISHIKSKHQNKGDNKALLKQQIFPTSQAGTLQIINVFEASVLQETNSSSPSVQPSVLQQIACAQTPAHRINSIFDPIVTTTFNAANELILNKSVSSLTCAFCFQQFAEEIELIEHEQLHRPDQIEKCGMCNEVFQTELLLRQHCWCKHRNESSQSFVCTICSFTSKRIGYFVRHVRVHTGEKPFLCTLCEKRYRSKIELVKHIKSSHERKQHNFVSQRIDSAHQTISQQILSDPQIESTQKIDSRRQAATAPHTITTLPAIALHTCTSHQDDVNAIEGICSLPLKKENESSLIRNAVAEETGYNSFIGISDVSMENLVLIKQEEPPFSVPQKTSHQEEIYVLKRECSPSLKEKNESSSQLDDNLVNDNNSTDAHLSQTNNGEVLCTNLHLKYSSPDLILSRIDDLYSTRNPCSHQCRVCPKIFHRISARVGHERTHTDTLPCYSGNIVDRSNPKVISDTFLGKCVEIKQEMSSQNSTDAHLSQTSNVEVQCTNFYLKYSSPDLILRRIDDSYSTRKPCSHQCRVCPKIFQRISARAGHERTHTDTLPCYSGNIADESNLKVISDSSLEKCVEIKQEMSSQPAQNAMVQAVDQCLEMRRITSALQAISQQSVSAVKIRPDPSAICRICQETFETKLLLWQHFQCKHCDASSDSFICSFCLYSSKNVTDFMTHLRMHTDEKQYACTQCEKQYITKSRLVQHIKFVHKNEMENKDLVAQDSASVSIAEQTTSCGTSRSQAVATHTSSRLVQQSVCVPQAVDQQFKILRGPITHTCSFCFQQFFEKIEMIKHKKLHRPDPSKKCGICQEMFQTELLMRQHYQCKHRDRSTRIYTCSYCLYTTKRVEDFISHVRLHTGEKPYVCTECGKRWITKQSLVTHVRVAHQYGNDPQCRNGFNVHKAKRFMCTKCNKRFSNVNNLFIHTKQVHSVQYPLNAQAVSQQTSSVSQAVSEQTASARRAISQQTVSAPQAVSHQTVCAPQAITEPMFTNKSQAIAPQTISTVPTVTEPISAPCLFTHSCSFCLQQFAEKIKMLEHEQLHRPDPSEKCGICRETCSTEILFEDHYLCEHQDKSTKSFICTFCSFTCKRVKGFICHLRLHTYERPYVCTECGMRCIDKSSLVTHVRVVHPCCNGPQYSNRFNVHTPERPFVCMKCSERYDNASQLFLHIKHFHSVQHSLDTQAVSLQTVSASHVIKVKDSLIGENESSSKLDDDGLVNDNSNDDNLSQTQTVEIQCTNVNLKYSTPDIILSRIDDLCNTRKRCCHQCRVCPKIFQLASDLARHERSHTNSHSYASS